MPAQTAGAHTSQNHPQEIQFSIFLGPKYLKKDQIKLCQNSIFSQQWANRPSFQE